MKSPTEKTCEVIKWVMAHKGMTVMAIEDRSGIPRGSIGKWLACERKSISAENVGKILLAFPEVCADFVMRDKGGMFGDDAPDPAPAPNDEITRLRSENVRLKGMLDAAQTYIAALQQIKSS